MIYLDTSAALKAVVDEDGSQDVLQVFAGTVPRVSSKLLAVEMNAVAVRRRLPMKSIEPVLDAVNLIALDDDIAQRAIDLRSGLRSLDALHLATATKLLPVLTGFLTFDDELRQAAEGRRLPLVL